MLVDQRWYEKGKLANNTDCTQWWVLSNNALFSTVIVWFALRAATILRKSFTATALGVKFTLRSSSRLRRRLDNYAVRTQPLQMLDLSLLLLTPRVWVYQRGGSSRHRNVGISFFQLA